MSEFKSSFQTPEGVTEISDDYQLGLCHFEMLNLKPKGLVQFAKEAKEIHFRFFTTPNRSEGIFAKLEDPVTPSIKRVFDYLEKYPRTESFVQVLLLQFKLLFIAQEVRFVPNTQNKTIHFPFPLKLLKTHRRKYIRIPFNDQFPAFLQIKTDQGFRQFKLKDMSREGMRIVINSSDYDLFKPGVRLKLATLKVINKDMPLGLQVIQNYPGDQVGLKIIAISESDQAWLQDCIRIMMKQILNLPSQGE